jgi:hypothetical protein
MGTPAIDDCPENAEVRRDIGDRVSTANELSKADADLPGSQGHDQRRYPPPGHKGAIDGAHQGADGQHDAGAGPDRAWIAAEQVEIEPAR